VNQVSNTTYLQNLADAKADELVWKRDWFASRPQQTGFTIDPVDSTDMDDAIWIEELGEHRVSIQVSITDISQVVELDSAIDSNAKEKVESLYYGHKTDNMLPDILAEDKCSLRPKRKRLAVTVSFEFNLVSLEISHIQIQRTTLISKNRLSYEQVEKVFTKKSQIKVLDSINRYLLVAERLLQRRKQRGAVVIFDVDQGWITNEEGQLVKTDSRYGHSQLIVQEFMIAANEAVAWFAHQNNIPILFRNHTLLKTYDQRAEYVAQIQELIDTKSFKKLQESIMFEAKQPKARYGRENRGHDGLELDYYTHFTSPIRRYPDLVTARNIMAFVENRPLVYSADDLDKLADHINNYLGNNHKRRRNANIAHSLYTSLQVLESDLTDAPSKEFNRAIIAAYERKLGNQDLFNEIKRRFTTGEISRKVMAYFLALPIEKLEDWKFIRPLSLEYTYLNPSKAFGVFSRVLKLISQGDNTYDFYTYTTKTRLAIEYSTVIKAKINGQKYLTPPIVSSDRRISEEMAAHQLLCQLTDQTEFDYSIYSPEQYQLDPEYQLIPDIAFQKIMFDLSTTLEFEYDVFIERVNKSKNSKTRRVVAAVEIDDVVYFSQITSLGHRTVVKHLACRELLYLLFSLGLIDKSALPYPEVDHLNNNLIQL
jgi:hypothetical protein